MNTAIEKVGETLTCLFSFSQAGWVQNLQLLVAFVCTLNYLKFHRPSNSLVWPQFPSRSWQRRNSQTSSYWEPSEPLNPLQISACKQNKIKQTNKRQRRKKKDESERNNWSNAKSLPNEPLNQVLGTQYFGESYLLGQKGANKVCKESSYALRWNHFSEEMYVWLASCKLL